MKLSHAILVILLSRMVFIQAHASTCRPGPRIIRNCLVQTTYETSVDWDYTTNQPEKSIAHIDAIQCEDGTFDFSSSTYQTSAYKPIFDYASSIRGYNIRVSTVTYFNENCDSTIQKLLTNEAAIKLAKEKNISLGNPVISTSEREKVQTKQDERIWKCYPKIQGDRKKICAWYWPDQPHIVQEKGMFFTYKKQLRYDN